MFDDLRELYQEVILDHGRSPRNHRHPDDATRTARGNNPLCGDQLNVYLKVNPQGVVEDAAFEGRGCAISIASASMMTEVLRGKSEAEACLLFEEFHKMCTGEDDVGDGTPEMEKLRVLSGVREYPVRVKCATLPWHTMRAALGGEATEVSTE
ncbi:MAG: Fe-S cluster assembly sulfur transfer protein SufU [Alphaproteobacteria bacterium]